MKRSSFLSLSLLLLLFSCDKPEVQPDYFIFGHFYGFCAGETCIELFKVEGGKLYEDQNDTYPSSQQAYVGNWVELSDAKYQQVKDLAAKVPQALLDNPDAIIGMPDYADGGGLYVELKTGNEVDYWLIDLVTENIPVAMRSFVNEAAEASRDLE